MNGTGLVINGSTFTVPGVTVVNRRDVGWAELNSGDGINRSWQPQMIVAHKTKADDPEKVIDSLDGAPTDCAKRVADFWSGDPAHSGAHLVASWDYTACLADLATFEAWHARAANPRSVGIEHYEEAGGIVRRQTLVNGVAVVRRACGILGIQYQCPTSYAKPLSRFRDGGSTLFGLFGHRDVDDTRNRWDPGDAVFAMHVALGCERFDFETGEDLVAWKERQRWLNKQGHNLVVDGLPGKATTEALRLEGYIDGIWAFGKGPASAT